MSAEEAVEIAATKEEIMLGTLIAGSTDINMVQNESYTSLAKDVFVGVVAEDEEAVEIVAAEEGITDINMDQNESYTSLTRDVFVEVVAADETQGAVAGGSADINMNNNVSKCCSPTELDDDDVLPTIFEIVGVDSSKDSLPDDMQQHLENPCSPSKRNHSPVGEFLRNERRTKLRKAAANSDFEMQQLNQQIALTQQYTNEVIAMRREQTRLQEQLKREREELASQNEWLAKDLRELDVAAVHIFNAEAEVAILADEYAAQLHILGQEKEQIRCNIMSTMQPNFSNCGMGAMPMQPAFSNCSMSAMQPTTSNHNEMDARKEMILHVATRSSGEIRSTATITNNERSESAPMVLPMVQYETNDGSNTTMEKKAPLYSKGMNVYYNDTFTNDTNTPAIILDVHLDDSLEAYYSIRLEDGREKQTDSGHIQFNAMSTTNMEQTDKNVGDEGGDNGGDTVVNKNSPRDGSRQSIKEESKAEVISHQDYWTNSLRGWGVLTANFQM